MNDVLNEVVAELELLLEREGCYMSVLCKRRLEQIVAIGKSGHAAVPLNWNPAWGKIEFNPETFTSDWGPNEPRVEPVGNSQDKSKRRVPVRLWVTFRLPTEGGDWPVRCSQGEPNLPGWHEIRSDNNGGFFIEVPQ